MLSPTPDPQPQLPGIKQKQVKWTLSGYSPSAQADSSLYLTSSMFCSNVEYEGQPLKYHILLSFKKKRWLNVNGFALAFTHLRLWYSKDNKRHHRRHELIKRLNEGSATVCCTDGWFMLGPYELPAHPPSSPSCLKQMLSVSPDFRCDYLSGLDQATWAMLVSLLSLLLFLLDSLFCFLTIST